MAASDSSAWKLPRLRIDRDGGWLHEGEEVTHEGILSSLRQGLQADAAGHFLQIGPVRVPVEVEDAPYTVVRLESDLDAFWELKLGPWDVAAGCLMVEEAGGRATSPSGGPVDLNSPSVVASNGKIHGEMLATLRQVRDQAPRA